MALSALSTVFSVLLLFCGVVTAQFGPDPRWLVPDGSHADFNSAFTAGDTVTLSWKALNNSVSDLWLTHWDPTTYPWHASVATGIDISVAGTFKWTITLPSWTIANDGHFVLRFYPHNVAYSILQLPQNDSPGFVITNATTSSSASSSATATAMSTATLPVGISTPASTTDSQVTASTLTTVTTTNSAGQTVTATVTTAIPTSTGVASSSQPTSTPNSSGLSTGAKAGIGIACALAAILVLIAGFFLIRRRRRRSGDHSPRSGGGPNNSLEKDGYAMSDNPSPPSLKPFSPTVPGMVEADSSSASELKLPLVRPRVSDASEHAALMTSTATTTTTTTTRMRDDLSQTSDGRRWMNSRPPRGAAEVRGDNNYAVEKAGTMLRPGIHELG